MKATTTVKTIEICGACKGFGEESFVKRISIHEWEEQKRQCIKCGGSGRLSVTIEKTVEPFATSPCDAKATLPPSLTRRSTRKGDIRQRKDRRF